MCRRRLRPQVAAMLLLRVAAAVSATLQSHMKLAALRMQATKEARNRRGRKQKRQCVWNADGRAVVERVQEELPQRI